MSLDYQPLAPIDPTVDALRFDLNATGTPIGLGGWFVWWDVRKWATVFVQAVAETTWSTAILTLERSIDGRFWSALETAETMGTGSATSSTIDCTGFAYLRARLSTLEGSQKFAAITAFGKASK